MYCIEYFRFIHQLWNINEWKDMPVELQEILMSSQEEKASFLGMYDNIVFVFFFIPFSLSLTNSFLFTHFHSLSRFLSGRSEKSSWTVPHAKQYTIIGMMEQIRKWLSSLRIDWLVFDPVNLFSHKHCNCDNK